MFTFCQYYQYSHPYECQVKYSCSSGINKTYSRIFSYLPNEPNEDANFISNSIVEVLPCQTCSQYDFKVYNFSSDGDRAETHSVEKQNILRCPYPLSTLHCACSFDNIIDVYLMS